MLNRIIRWALTIALIVFVYQESGKWTALAFSVLFIYSETSGYFLARAIFVIDGIMAMLFPKDETQ